MTNLNIPKGEYHTNELQTRVECDNRLVATCLDGEGNAFTNQSQNIDKQKALAVLFSDAGNTYQKCHKLPSQFLEENERMKEALEYFVKRCEEGSIRSITTYRKYKELLKFLEQ